MYDNYSVQEEESSPFATKDKEEGPVLSLDPQKDFTEKAKNKVFKKKILGGASGSEAVEVKNNSSQRSALTPLVKMNKIVATHFITK